MNNIIKNTIYTIISLIFVVNFTASAMKRAADGILLNPADKKRKIEAIMKSPSRYSSCQHSLQGRIELDDNVTAGFGNSDCIEALNGAGISVKNNALLVPVKILIPNPKEKPEDELTFTDWTEETPPLIKHTINNAVEKQLKEEREALFSLVGPTFTPENKSIWMDWQTRNECIPNAAQRKIEQLRPVPLMPVHYLSASSKIRLNLFGCCDAQLTFDEHQKLDAQVKQFHETPGMFSLLDSGTESIIKEIEKIRTLPQAETELEMNIRQEKIATFNAMLSNIANEQMYETEEELQEKKLIKQKGARERTGNLDIIGYNMLHHNNKSYKPGDNCPNLAGMRSLELAHKLKKQKPFDIVRDRQLGLKNNNHYLSTE